MTSVTIDISDKQLQILQDLAKANGITVEVLLSASFGEWLSSQKGDFVNAANYVLKKNAELYKRLS